MANIVIFDKNSIPQKVLQYLESVNTPDYSTRDDVVVNPNIENLRLTPLKYWKHISGNIVEMDQIEKNAIDLEILTASDLQVRSNSKLIYDGFSDLPLALRSFAAITVDEINILRQWITLFKTEVALATSLADLKTRVSGLPNMGDRTLSQLKISIRNKIDSGSVDEK